MEYDICPYCGARVRKDEMKEHIESHIFDTENYEKNLLSMVRKEQKSVLLKFRDEYPELYVELLKEIAEENDIGLKKFSMKELLSMNRFDDAFKIFEKIIERKDSKEEWLDFIISLNQRGFYEKSIEICRIAMQRFNDEEFVSRMERIISKAEARL
ncbi:MAG: hypothetical protein J7K61_01800 [Thermoplasmata archaeon]|nr:hypothetical protein [Thermoplasmata archaeon]